MSREDQLDALCDRDVTHDWLITASEFAGKIGCREKRDGKVRWDASTDRAEVPRLNQETRASWCTRSNVYTERIVKCDRMS